MDSATTSAADAESAAQDRADAAGSELAAQAGAAAEAGDAPEAGAAPKRPARKRAPKPDALVAEAVDAARSALEDAFPGEAIGDHLGAQPEEDRVMTHRFTAQKQGYRGWQWYATLARAPRAKKITVNEIGLLPGEGALLAPAWVPWADRLRPEDTQQGDADQQAGGAEPGQDEPATAVEAPAVAETGGTGVVVTEERTEVEQAPAADGDHTDEDPTAEEIEASVKVKRRRRQRRYRANPKT
ncbi:DUF3027 domain-containing protein [Falsarthrobacter nasiphocae]|uniref:DUF3027 domain-containing protein n=2 Tax=Falsarthrobacter nasiphocae TaxID=189863 RepID=A0AAE3YH86_9MICC|nr:DUF3027 domain-containing protein [Falsarthrobacter nasiphocae]MDR6891736.1 hypothetical protein [Falsarthrobacter nasiphocae]